MFLVYPAPGFQHNMTEKRTHNFPISHNIFSFGHWHSHCPGKTDQWTGLLMSLVNVLTNFLMEIGAYYEEWTC